MNSLLRTRVKICGVTRPEDAQLAARLGADALGLVFYPPSARAVEPGSIAKIVEKLPAFVTIVGLFVNPEEATVTRVVESGLVQCLQFHGDESPLFCGSFGLPYVKAIRVRNLSDARRQLTPFRGACSVILDTYVSGEAGGTGKAFDWGVARELVEDNGNPVILAGGLSAENVSAAIAEVAPYGVDVSSGVETEPGIKDPDKLRRFFAVVNG